MEQKTILLIFLIISCSIVGLSIITICNTPIINNFTTKKGWNFSSWRTLNCQLLTDQDKSDDKSLSDLHKHSKKKNLCYRKKAMHDLEYASLIINLVLGFVCANLSLLHYFNVDKDNFSKKTGIIGIASGGVGFILTFVYICYSGYIIHNDIAFSEYPDTISSTHSIEKLFSNGATEKYDGAGFVTPSKYDKEDDSKYIKYKDLGKKQYNYDFNFYKIYQKNMVSNNCLSNSNSAGCDYIFGYPPFLDFENKELYDRWVSTIFLGCLIFIADVGLLLFGIFLFRGCGVNNSNQNNDQEPQVISINQHNEDEQRNTERNLNVESGSNRRSRVSNRH